MYVHCEPLCGCSRSILRGVFKDRTRPKQTALLRTRESDQLCSNIICPLYQNAVLDRVCRPQKNDFFCCVIIIVHAIGIIYLPKDGSIHHFFHRRCYQRSKCRPNRGTCARIKRKAERPECSYQSTPPLSKALPERISLSEEAQSEPLFNDTWFFDFQR